MDLNQAITDRYALYNGDCCQVMPTLPDKCVDLSVYSPPFCGLYNYSSDERDLSNCSSYDEFFRHYEFVVSEIARLTKPGRISAVHCMDIPSSVNAGNHLTDFPGDIIRLHERLGFKYIARHCVWKEPLGVRLRTMAKGLAHKTIVEDSSLCDVASADYLLLFRRDGQNKIPVEKHVHPLQLVVIERVVVLRSNPGETVLTPFLGVGSEAYGSIINGRRAIGIELKRAYFQQAVKNCAEAAAGNVAEEVPLLAGVDDEMD